MAKTRIGAPLVHANGPGETSWVYDLPVHGNPNYVVYHNDFLNAQNYDTTNAFNQVKDVGASVAIVTDGQNGLLTITSAATTSGDGGLIALNQENFSLLSGKKLWFSASVKGSSVAAMALFAGLAVAVATNPENVALDSTARIGFELINGSGVLQVKTSDGTNASAVSTGVTLTDDTFVKVDLVWDGGNSVWFYVNDSLVAQKTTNLPASSAKLAPTFEELSGSATGTRSATIDYFTVVAER